MANNLTNYGEELLIKHAFGITGSITPYVALYTASPGESGSQTSEVTGGSYVRKAMGATWNASGWAENAALIRWNGMPAVVVTHIAILDALTSGNMIWHGALSASVTVPLGYPMEIAAGSLQAALD